MRNPLRTLSLLSFAVLALSLGTALAQISGGGGDVDEEGDTYYSMFVSPEYSDYSLFIACYDFQDVTTKSPQETLELLEQNFDNTNVVGCYISASGDDAYFFSSDFGYTAAGTSYSFDYDEAVMTNGDSGVLRDGTSVSILLAVSEVERGDPFTLYYDDASVDITLGPWGQ